MLLQFKINYSEIPTEQMEKKKSSWNNSIRNDIAVVKYTFQVTSNVCCTLAAYGTSKKSLPKTTYDTRFRS